MSLHSHGIRQVYYAATYYAGGQPGCFGLGMTDTGYLTAFGYGPGDVMSIQLIWPQQLAADVSHQVGVSMDGREHGERVLRMYVDGVPHPSPTGPAPQWGVSHRASVGGAWYGYDSRDTQANAHWVSLGQWSWWHRLLTDEEMRAVHTAGLPWTSYEIDRVTKVLDFAGWPTGWRAGLTFPHSTYQLLATPNWEVGATALELVQRAIGSVDGIIFVAADGTLTYQRITDRNVRAAPTLIFAEGDGTAIEGDFAYTVDDNDIINVVTATTRSGLAFQRSDPTSIARYDERSATVDSDLAHPSDVAAAAARRINRYKTPILRCPTVTLDVAAAPDSMLAAFDLELGDNIGLAGLPATAPADAMTVVVESIEWSIDADTQDWKVKLEVSPGSMYTRTQVSHAKVDDTRLGG